jgi:L-ascorbate metabolism protein UlaG (beta-lactamase superfamily)
MAKTKFSFQNPADSPERDINFVDVLRLFYQNYQRGQSITPEQITWDNRANLAKRLKEVGSQDFICWLGHASYLLQLQGHHILIDPLFSDYAGPLPWLSSKRYVPVALTQKELPKIDYILITHNHYDHLDKPFLRQCRHKDQTQVIVPQGLGSTLKKWGFAKVKELNWYESWQTSPLQVTALPAYHYSRRSLFDRNRSWWCSYALTDGKTNIFHGGDSGYGKVFQAIGQQYGPFDYAMIGIGAYEPAKMLQAVHTNPKEALQIALDIQARVLLPMHWGTVLLTPEPIKEPIEKLHEHFQQLSDKNSLGIQGDSIGDIIKL